MNWIHLNLHFYDYDINYKFFSNFKMVILKEILLFLTIFTSPNKMKIFFIIKEK